MLSICLILFMIFLLFASSCEIFKKLNLFFCLVPIFITELLKKGISKIPLEELPIKISDDFAKEKKYF